MKNKNKSDINPDIIEKINNSLESENVKECLKELIEFEYENIDEYGLRFKDTYLKTIDKWKKYSEEEDSL